MNYLNEIAEIVGNEVQRRISDLQYRLNRAESEAAAESRLRTEEWREAHVQERIHEYRQRWEVAQKKLDDITRIVESESDSKLNAIERIIKHGARETCALCWTATNNLRRASGDPEVTSSCVSHSTLNR